METVKRDHSAETGDSQADACPVCNGGKVFPANHQRAGQPCDTCAGSGFLLRQRRDANGNPTRVRIAAAEPGSDDAVGSGRFGSIN